MCESRPLLSVFLPDRLELIKGPPAVRRAHLDQVVSAMWPLRAADRRGVLARARPAQRAAGAHPLRTCIARRRSPPGTASWPAVRSSCATNRAAAVALLAEPFAERASQLGLQRRGEPRVPAALARGDEEEFVAELQERLAGDLERGFTGHGPHRDELAILRDGRELRVYGSQGEQRLALLALLLAERAVLAGERRRMPLMLLDDVMSELDAERRELLARELARGGQSVIATTDLAHVPGRGDASVTRLRDLAGRDPPGGARRVSRTAPPPARRSRCRSSPRTLAPASTLARVQEVWERAGGPGDRRCGAPDAPSATVC